MLALLNPVILHMDAMLPLFLVMITMLVPRMIVTPIQDVPIPVLIVTIGMNVQSIYVLLIGDAIMKSKSVNKNILAVLYIVINCGDVSMMK